MKLTDEQKELVLDVVNGTIGITIEGITGINVMTKEKALKTSNALDKLGLEDILKQKNIENKVKSNG